MHWLLAAEGPSMYDITIDDFPSDRLAEIVHWRNDRAVNKYLRQGIRTLDEVQEWYAQYFSRAEHKFSPFAQSISDSLNLKLPVESSTQPQSL